jgi:hypothetical protein
MDPYLEAHWRDVHARLIIYASDALQSVLPGSLRSRVEERVLFERLARFADHVRLIESRRELKGEIAVADPVIVETETETETENYLEIIDRESGNRVITVIEFLSPSNKSPGPNREQYLRKQREICSSDTNLVEIDLNRFATHTLAFPLAHLKPKGRSGYMTCVRHVTQRSKAEVYPMFLWDRLPVVKIPLRPKDADVPLDLQALVGMCYRNGAYEGTLNYAVDPDPPLLGAEKEWAENWLKEKGLRRRKGKPKSNG